MTLSCGQILNLLSFSSLGASCDDLQLQFLSLNDMRPEKPTESDRIQEQKSRPAPHNVGQSQAASTPQCSQTSFSACHDNTVQSSHSFIITHINNMLYLVLLVAFVASLVDCSRLTPPVLPLIVRNPYLSTWLPSARSPPWSQWPMFWTGESIGFSVLASVPESSIIYPLLGRPHDSLPVQR